MRLPLGSPGSTNSRQFFHNRSPFRFREVSDVIWSCGSRWEWRHSMRYFRLLTLGIVSALWLAGHAYAGESLDRVFASRGTVHSCVGSNNQCNILRSPGGEMGTFLRAAAEVKSEQMLLVIDGPCASACVLLADYARP